MIVGTSPAEIIDWLVKHWAAGHRGSGCRGAMLMLCLILKYLYLIVYGVVSWLQACLLYALVRSA